MIVTYSLDVYRDRPRRAPRSADGPHISSDSDGPLQPGAGSNRVAAFADGRLRQRYEKLQAACEILADGLDELNDDIEQYVKVVPLTTRDSGAGDAERFLQWLSRRAGIVERPPANPDHNASLRGVEFVAVKQRLAHVRFQELLSMNARLLPELESNGRLTVHLNPIHVWSWSDTTVPARDDDTQSAVLFFPVGEDIRTAEVDADGADLIRFLERRGTMTVKDLCKLCLPDERPSVLRMLRNLAEMGMIALR